MQPHIKLLDEGLVERIIGEAFELLQDPGLKIHSGYVTQFYSKSNQ